MWCWLYGEFILRKYIEVYVLSGFVHFLHVCNKSVKKIIATTKNKPPAFKNDYKSDTR